MTINPKSPGMRSYLYEHLFQQTIDRTQQATGKTIMVSAARALRSQVEARLAQDGLSMTDSDLRISPVLTAIESVMSESVPGYPRLFAEATSASPAYQQMQADFFDMAGIARVVDGATVQPRLGSHGPVLPISPYDPRWAVRGTVKSAGSRVLYALDHEIAQLAGGNVERLSKVTDEDLRLYAVDADDKISDAGQALSVDDLSGMSELMDRMSEQEYRDVRDWVVSGARNTDGSINRDAFMSAEAVGRSRAILDELAEQGVPYTVRRDRNPGQIKADIEGTKISVRLTEPRKGEHFVGRVYDDGVLTYYSTNVRIDGEQRTAPYTPSAAEAVALLRLAQGKPVERFDGQGLVGLRGTHDEMEWSPADRRKVSVPFQDSYYNRNDSASMALVGDLIVDGEPVGPDAKVFVRRAAKARTSTAKFFATSEQAETHLRDSIDSARQNLANKLEVDRLITEHTDHEEAAAAGEWFPKFSGYPEIAAIQRSYWDVLRGDKTTLLRPGATEEEYLEKVGVIGELQIDGDEAQNVHDMLVGSLAYTGSPQDKVRGHADDVIDELLGTYEPRETTTLEGEEVLRRFDPVRVGMYMTSEFGIFRRNADIVAALRATGIDPDELMGSGFTIASIKDRLVEFDAESAVSPEAHGDAFVARMGALVRDSIERSGGQVTSLLVDDQGVVSWSAQRFSRTGKAEPVSGQIGQIFGRGEHGEIVTRFAGGDNYLFVPGHEARISAQRAGEDRSVEERTLLRGYEQIMADQIQYQVASDMLVMRTAVGEPTSLNGVYRRLYDVRHDVDFIERSAEEGLSTEWVEAILATEARRVRYPSEIASGSTIHAAWRAENSTAATDPANDNHLDAWILTGQRNMAIMTEEGDGYFDPIMTNGAVYQGITRYLVEGASVDPSTGAIVPSQVETVDPSTGQIRLEINAADRAPLMKLPATADMRFDPYDRQQMSASNLLNAAAVTEPVGVAMMTFGGWTADDPMAVSREFAEKHAIRGADGTLRPLVPGDKLSDLHGNKGVISLVVDREAVAGVDFDAEDQSMAYAVQVFADNPDLDVVMSPFSAVSRFNGGTARELMGSPGDLVLPERGLTKDTMGRMQLVVTHKDVERGTRVYDEAALREGRGRKASSQLAWALGSQGCDQVMAEFYGPNNSAVSNFREMLVTMGMDLEPDGTLRVGYDDLATGADRHLFEMPELIFNARGGLNANRMKRDFGDLIGDRGGDLELPFPLKFPTGHIMPKASESTWRMPVLSSHLRSGQDLEDGQSTAHDYTNQYLAIHEMACKYRMAKEDLDERAPVMDGRTIEETRSKMVEAQRRAQSAFDIIADDLKSKRFSGKRNVFKEGLMSSRLPNSATAVWTSDPRLDIDQLAMGPAMAEALGLANDDYALVWRDPVLRDAGVRYLRVSVDPRLTGVAINPVMDKCFDGDFDGDSVAVVRLTSKPARDQAMQRLTVEANLLDLGQFGEDAVHPLAMQDSLDVKVSQHFNPALAERFADLTMRANEVQSDLEDGEIDEASAWEARHVLVGELSDYYKEAMQSQYGDAILRFGDAGDHVQSVIEACIDTGAKGSMAKIEDYCRHIGVDPATMADLGDTQHTRAEDEGVMMATAVKSHGTGIAGTFSQRGVKALRNSELKAVLELTYPVTQSVLQAKHDPEEARQKYNMLMGPARALWRGRKLETGAGPDGVRAWSVVKDERGNEIQADAETWKSQFVDLYTSKDGLNVSVNRANVEKVAAALSGPSGIIVDIEDPQDKTVAELGSTMDRLAYGGAFEDVFNAADARENIFTGSENAHFAPYGIRANQLAIGEWERQIEAGLDVPAPEVAPLVNRDVLAEYDPRARARGAGRPSHVAATVRAPRPRPVFETDGGDPAYASAAPVDDYQL